MMPDVCAAIQHLFHLVLCSLLYCLSMCVLIPQVQVPEDLKAREGYLRRQRDRLLEMRRVERARKLDSYGASSASSRQKGSSRQKPGSSRQVALTVAEQVTSGKQAPAGEPAMATPGMEGEGKSSRLQDRDFDTGVLCTTIASRLKEDSQ